MPTNIVLGIRRTVCCFGMLDSIKCSTLVLHCTQRNYFWIILQSNRQLEPPLPLNFSCGTTKSNSIPHTNFEFILTSQLKSNQFDPHSNIKWISMPPHKKPSRSRSTHLNQVFIDPLANTKSILIPASMSSQFWCQLSNQVNFDAATPKPR